MNWAVDEYIFQKACKVRFTMNGTSWNAASICPLCIIHISCFSIVDILYFSLINFVNWCFIPWFSCLQLYNSGILNSGMWSCIWIYKLSAWPLVSMSFYNNRMTLWMFSPFLCNFMELFTKVCALQIIGNFATSLYIDSYHHFLFCWLHP